MQISFFFCNFVAVMQKHLLLIIFLILFGLNAKAEFVTLRTGKTIQGTILVQNEEVTIIRDSNGQRYQYPTAEVVSIQSVQVEEEKTKPTPQQMPEEKPKNSTAKRTTFMVEVAGAAMTEPHQRCGGAITGNLLIGSRQIAGKEVVLGGWVGYHGCFFPAGELAKQSLHFLPIALAFRMPLIANSHAPIVGATIGYGIGLSKNYTGGIYSGIDLGYRFSSANGSIILVAANVQFQQVRMTTTERVDGTNYTGKLGRNLVSPGVKVAFSF